jgi:hypothetical protein
MSESVYSVHEGSWCIFHSCPVADSACSYSQYCVSMSSEQFVVRTAPGNASRVAGYSSAESVQSNGSIH